MKLLLGFLPFALFAVIEHCASLVPALVAALAAATSLVVRDRIAGRRVKLLELGAMAVFGGLTVIALVSGATWSILQVRLIADAGLFVLVAGSLISGHPFTLAYAREQTPEAVWVRPEFVHKNARITGAWTAAFGVHVIADIAMMAGLPILLGGGLTLAALVAAALFTSHSTRQRA